MEGWIKLHRSVLEHRHNRKRRVFSEYEAWIDMLLLANYSDKEMDIEGQSVQIQRGSFVTSQMKLADRWNWDKRKVVSFLKESETHDEIEVKTEKRWTVITVLNYGKYQGKNVEIEIKSVPTFTPTFAPTLCTDFSPEISSENDISCTDFTHRLLHRSMHTTNKYIKNNKEKPLSFYEQVITYLNEKAGTRYRATVQKTKTLIDARKKEGFTLDDFKTVIDTKCKEWVEDKDMKKYLRPETLFGTKFESYLNQGLVKPKTNEIPLYQPSKEDLEYYERISTTRTKLL